MEVLLQKVRRGASALPISSLCCYASTESVTTRQAGFARGSRQAREGRAQDPQRRGKKKRKPPTAPPASHPLQGGQDKGHHAYSTI